MGDFREKLIRFFNGRYGVDDFEKFLCIFYFAFVLITAILSIFLSPVVVLILRIISSLILVYIFFRMLSRSIQMRMRENRIYLNIKNSIFSWIKLQKNRFRDRKTHIYKKCPHCKAVLRLKKIKGEHRAACPRCGKCFDVTVR